MNLIDSIAVGNELGEGVIWDHRRSRVWWTDIQGGQIYRYALETQALEQWVTPERVCCFAPVDQSESLAVAFESGFAFYNPESGKIDWIKRLEKDNPGTRFNDGRTDRAGRLWSGTMVEDPDRANDKGALYCLNHDLSVRKTISGLSIPNSLCWSPDGRVMYHTDTPTRKIYRYVFDSTSGSIGDFELFVQTERGCFPDGSIVDSEGYLWNAQWGGSQVVRYSPQGEIDLTLKVPATQPSCVAFAGQDLNLLVVTSAHQGMTEEQRADDLQAGNVFIFDTNFTGLVESEFKPTA